LLSIWEKTYTGEVTQAVNQGENINRGGYLMLSIRDTKSTGDVTQCAVNQGANINTGGYSMLSIREQTSTGEVTQYCQSGRHHQQGRLLKAVNQGANINRGGYSKLSIREKP
jgi:hypothetical protein